jgi:hypothetical protein
VEDRDVSWYYPCFYSTNVGHVDDNNSFLFSLRLGPASLGHVDLRALRITSGVGDGCGASYIEIPRFLQTKANSGQGVIT